MHRIFPTGGNGERVPPTSKTFTHTPRPRKIPPPSRLTLPPHPFHYGTKFLSSPLLTNNFQVITQ